MEYIFFSDKRIVLTFHCSSAQIFRLSTLYETLFHKKLEGAHDAAADVDALEAVLTHEVRR